MMRDPLDVHIGGRVRTLRSMRRLSLEQIGEQVGLSYQQIRKYELGDNRISASTLFRIASVLGVEIGYFFQNFDDGSSSVPFDGELNEQFGELLQSLRDEKIRTLLQSLLVALREREDD